MGLKKTYLGFDESFLIDKAMSLFVKLPTIGSRHKNDIAFERKSEEHIIKYVNYSLALSASRKFPFFTASNINGELFKKANRRTYWKKDKRVKKYQWGRELYSAVKSDFDKGHMTKREDVQWGITPALAQLAANSTFFYSNAVPQHKDLNRKIWRNLEDYILHKETKANELKICVFTGPVLSQNDPFFVTPYKGEMIQIPVLFWKIIMFPKNDGSIHRVGFIMSQQELLSEDGLIKRSELEVAREDDELFMQFKDAETYQVNISLIEELSGLKFYEAIDSYTDKRSKRLVLKEVDIDPDLESISLEQFLGYAIENLTL